MVGRFVVKRNGDIEPYSEEKVIHSMGRVGVPHNLQPQVLSHIRAKFKGEYITTDELFHHIFEFLEPRDKKATLRFNLRRAIFDLGPTGFPFEKYISRIFQSQGFKTTVGSFMDGECVRHEIDVLIEKDGKKEMVEVKFHNDGGTKTDVHVVLYTYARYLDLKTKNNIEGVWVITNTKLTTDAILYAKCKGIKTLGWNYPNGASLQDFVEKPRMYPITVLPELTHEERRVLTEDNIILCSDLLAMPEQEINYFQFVKRTHLKKAVESARIILEDF